MFEDVDPLEADKRQDKTRDKTRDKRQDKRQETRDKTRDNLGANWFLKPLRRAHLEHFLA